MLTVLWYALAKSFSHWIFKYCLNRNRNDGKNQTSIEFSTKVQKCAHITMKMWCVYNTQPLYTKNTCIMNKCSIFSFIIFDVIRLALFAGTPFHFVLYKSRVKSNTSVRAAVLLIYIAISYVFLTRICVFNREATSCAYEYMTVCINIQYRQMK